MCHFNTFSTFRIFEFLFLWIFALFKVWNWPNQQKFRAPKMAVLELLDSLKLISRKIWMIGKSWNFHTVQLFVYNFHPLLSTHLWKVGYTERKSVHKSLLLTTHCASVRSPAKSKLSKPEKRQDQHWRNVRLFSHDLVRVKIINSNAI